MFLIVFLYKPFWWRPCTALITTSPDHRTISESFSFLQIPTIFHSLPSMVLSKAKTLTHHTSHAMRLIDCRIIFKDQAVMVIELHIRLGIEAKVCITSSFNLLHLSQYCSLWVRCRATALRRPLLAVLLMVFLQCWGPSVGILSLTSWVLVLTAS